MHAENTDIEGVVVFSPRSFPDSRGFFLENFRNVSYKEYGVPDIVQWNHSRSNKGVLRGIHIQYPLYQGKLVYVVRGAIYDIAVDLRKDSPTYGKYYSLILDDENHKQLWIPEGFGHAFYTLSSVADVLYGCTSYYESGQQYSIRYDDPDIGIDWKDYSIQEISEKDSQAPYLQESIFYYNT